MGRTTPGRGCPSSIYVVDLPEVVRDEYQVFGATDESTKTIDETRRRVVSWYAGVLRRAERFMISAGTRRKRR